MSTVTNRKVKANKSDASLGRGETCSLGETLDSVSVHKRTTTPPTAKFLSQKTVARFVVILSLLAIVYFSGKSDQLKIFAKQSEFLPGRGQNVECSEGYRKDLFMFEGCFPKDCGRFVTDKLIEPREADILLEVAKKGLALGGSDGGASILDLHSGALSFGKQFVDIYRKKEAKGLFTESDFNIYRLVRTKVQTAIAQHFGVYPDKLYLTHPTFFSQITDRKAVTVHDEYWHPHVDKETYKSFHYTSLLYLNDYNMDFTGGRFVFVGEPHNRTIEPRKGRISMFTSGAENSHYVERVTSGIRYAMTISFTCDKNFSIGDPSIEKYK